MARNRNNPLALAVLICLYERPMHPYEMATTLRQRNKHESVRLNYGSLYSVVASLNRRGLIEPKETAREGRLPERTIYELTETGRIEMHDWLTELVSVPVKEYPAFGAALSFLPALVPDEAVALLVERAQRLEIGIAQVHAAREVVEKLQLPRLFWVEDEYQLLLLEAELAYVRRLIEDIVGGRLEGTDWWRRIHADPDGLEGVPHPPIGARVAVPGGARVGTRGAVPGGARAAIEHTSTDHEESRGAHND